MFIRQSEGVKIAPNKLTSRCCPAGPGPCTLYFAGIVVCLYIAAWFYARHLPERWYPGRFDLFGNSHQIMHTLVVIEYALEWAFVIHLARVQQAASVAQVAAQPVF